MPTSCAVTQAAANLDAKWLASAAFPRRGSVGDAHVEAASVFTSYLDRKPVRSIPSTSAGSSYRGSNARSGTAYSCPPSVSSADSNASAATAYSAGTTLSSMHSPGARRGASRPQRPTTAT
eukprot:CAMPEP_0170270878 /NCGR_PEP_ID=MMETSP0116_2-20130129/35387_1 /TAXON_ID=400756 /ORGANISM="Durinskia baltica, Strain CSIRO CS-38" /LENGTH=120 /DNA_ID=CAMNT_0010522077 /DNA_START=1 /DNA_END=359 /DNA_ORIENTATION=-